MTQEWDSLPREELVSTLGICLPPGFGFDLSSINALIVFVEYIFDASLSVSSDSALWKPGITTSKYVSVDTLQSIFYGSLSGCPTDGDHLTCTVDNVAKAMTKTFRDSAYVAQGLDAATVTFGETWTSVSYVRIG